MSTPTTNLFPGRFNAGSSESPKKEASDDGGVATPTSTPVRRRVGTPATPKLDTVIDQLRAIQANQVMAINEFGMLLYDQVGNGHQLARGLYDLHKKIKKNSDEMNEGLRISLDTISSNFELQDDWNKSVEARMTAHEGVIVAQADAIRKLEARLEGRQD